MSKTHIWATELGVFVLRVSHFPWHVQCQLGLAFNVTLTVFQTRDGSLGKIDGYLLQKNLLLRCINNALALGI